MQSQAFFLIAEFSDAPAMSVKSVTLCVPVSGIMEGKRTPKSWVCCADMRLLDRLGDLKIFVFTWTNDSQQMDQPC